jgi:alkylhydroperoxidase family enzyme
MLTYDGIRVRKFPRDRQSRLWSGFDSGRNCRSRLRSRVMALAEAATRRAGGPIRCPAGIWDEAARHCDEQGLVTLVLVIATCNLFDRFSITAGGWW